MGIKRCGVLRKGIPCDVLISTERSACDDCCQDVLEVLERMADMPQVRAIPPAIVNRLATGCGCGKDIDRPGQAMCKACHREYMRDWRERHIYVERPKIEAPHGA